MILIARIVALFAAARSFASRVRRDWLIAESALAFVRAYWPHLSIVAGSLSVAAFAVADGRALGGALIGSVLAILAGVAGLARRKS